MNRWVRHLNRGWDHVGIEDTLKITNHDPFVGETMSKVGKGFCDIDQRIEEYNRSEKMQLLY